MAAKRNAKRAAGKDTSKATAKKKAAGSKSPGTKPAAKKAAGKKAPAKAGPAKKVAKKAPAAKATAKKAVAKKAPAKKAVAKKAPKAAAKKAPDKKAPAQKAGNAPTKKTPAAKKAVEKKAPAKAQKSAPKAAKPSAPAATESAKSSKATKSSAPPATRTKSQPPRRASAGKPLADGPPISVRPSRSSDGGRRPLGSESADAGESTQLRSGASEATRVAPLPIPVMEVPPEPTVEERAASIETRLAAQDEDFQQKYQANLDMSWIFHDSALEGVVYTYAELQAALGDEPAPVTDSSLQPTVEDIRRHKQAIEFVRDEGIKKKGAITVDVIKKIYLILHPSEGDVKTVRYRKDIPQHRLYFHEYAPPDKITYKVRQVVDWLNDPETRRTRTTLRLAARAHYDLLRVFPFTSDSGKVARLFMNLILLRSGLPAAIIHSTERQRYYDALKGSANTVLQMVEEAVENALSSIEKLLDEHETKKRAFVS